MCFSHVWKEQMTLDHQVWIQDFKLGGRGALKKIAPSEGRRENLWGISCANLQGSENGRVVTIDSIHGYT